jgi:hypothetical protein
MKSGTHIFSQRVTKSMVPRDDDSATMTARLQIISFQFVTLLVTHHFISELRLSDSFVSTCADNDQITSHFL